MLTWSGLLQFSLLVELNILVYLAMLHSEVISSEWGSCMGLNGEWGHMGLNGEWGQMGVEWGSHMGLILVPYDLACHADHFDICLVFL